MKAESIANYRFPYIPSTGGYKTRLVHWLLKKIRQYRYKVCTDGITILFLLLIILYLRTYRYYQAFKAYS